MASRRECDLCGGEPEESGRPHCNACSWALLELAEAEADASPPRPPLRGRVLRKPIEDEPWFDDVEKALEGP